VFLHIAAQRVPKLVGRHVQPLARLREQLVGPRQDACELGQMPPAILHPLAEAAQQAALKAAEPEIMRGVSKGILHKNTGARKVSRLTKRVAKLGK